VLICPSQEDYAEGVSNPLLARIAARLGAPGLEPALPFPRGRSVREVEHCGDRLRPHIHGVRSLEELIFEEVLGQVPA
jgi:hypothetical protein